MSDDRPAPPHPLETPPSGASAVDTTVIVSTYNNPDYLEKVLHGYAAQTDPAFEIVLADDGSNAAARERTDALLARLPLRVRRVWQEDEGFRKTKILNAAIAEARGDYLVFTDGDCIPFPDFVALHRSLRRPGRFVSAGALRLPEGPTAAILEGRLRAPEMFTYPALRAAGLPDRLKYRRLFAGEAVRRALDVALPIKRTFNGLNAACWKADALAAGGFNEAMGYGSEDVEFGVRLAGLGLRPLMARHRLRALHLDHSRPYVAEGDRAANRAILLETRARLKSAP